MRGAGAKGDQRVQVKAREQSPDQKLPGSLSKSKHEQTCSNDTDIYSGGGSTR